MNTVVDCLIHGVKPGEKYPPGVLAFSISLHTTSAKAYRYVREKFGKNLPHPDTIKEWFRSSDLDASSGITEHSMNALEKLSNQMLSDTPGKPLVAALLMDEMAIKRNMMWDRATNTFIGAIDCGSPNADDDITLANNALVFMVSGMNVFIQQPVAYYFIKTLKANDRAELVLKNITELSKRNIKVKTLIFDGYSSNVLMCDILGANFKAKDGNYITHFKNPHDNDIVYIMYDPSHCQKLIRNTIGNVGTIFAGKDKVEWKFFQELVKQSKNKNIGLTHKMNKRHIEYKNRKMHVRTAVETLSSSTANCMELFMQNGTPGFAGALGTIKFIRIFDRLWDIMNTHRIKTGTKDVYKSALNPENKVAVFKFLSEAQNYICSLKVKSPKNGKLKLILQSMHKTGFRGFVIGIISLREMYRELVEEHHWLLFFATYRISQDHLEMLFGIIRSINGPNDNPMVHQFLSAYRKILHQCEITHSPYANVTAIAKSSVKLATSNILTVPSTRKRQSKWQADAADAQIYTNLRPPTDNAENINEFQDWDLLQHPVFFTDNTENFGIAYLAKRIESRLTDCDQIYCEACLQVLHDDRKIDKKFCTGSSSEMPCMSSYKICKLTDDAINLNINSGENMKKKILVGVLNSIDWNNIFPDFDQYEHDFEHKYFLIKFFIDEYCNKKCAYIAKQKMLDLEKNYVRNKLRKLCHVLHQ